MCGVCVSVCVYVCVCVCVCVCTRVTECQVNDSVLGQAIILLRVHNIIECLTHPPKVC